MSGTTLLLARASGEDEWQGPRVWAGLSEKMTWKLDRIRRLSDPSAFVVPVDASLVR